MFRTRPLPTNLLVATAGLGLSLLVSTVTTAEIDSGANAGENSSPANEMSAERLFDVMGGLTVAGRTLRDSEMGHPDYDASLAGETMARTGEAWLGLLQAAATDLVEDDRLRAGRDDDSQAGPRTYASAGYSYHMHHSAGRFEEHGLYDRLTLEVSPLLTLLSRQLLTNQLVDGAFRDLRSDTVTNESMAWGLDAFHGVAYGWIRWHKPGGADDMGGLTEPAMERAMGHDLDTLIAKARDLAGTLDGAWDEDAGMYRFDSAIWALDEFGALVRGHKGVYEVLYVFGDEDDQDKAADLFDRIAVVLEGIIDSDLVVRDWGLPARLRFRNGVAHPAVLDVDIAAQWRFVHALTGGFSLIREQDGTSKFLENRRSGLRDGIGGFTDRLLAGGLEYHLMDDRVVNRVSFVDGSRIDGSASTGTMAAFVMALGNAYRVGDAFDRPDGWDDPDIESRSRDLYDALLAHTEELLETAND